VFAAIRSAKGGPVAFCRHVGREEVFAAIRGAKGGPVEEGSGRWNACR